MVHRMICRLGGAAAMLAANAMLLLLAASSTPARAGSDAYSANDIVAFFEQQKMMLNTRGICVGSDEECAAAAVKDHASAFDLLISFDKSSSALTGEARGKLIEFSVALRNPALSNLRFAIDGFTDASGNPDYNLGLSARRAKSVVQFLQSLGVAPGTLVARGWGETNFRSDNPLDPANRRVETRIIR